MEHKLIRGGEQYLPFARSRIKAIKATGLKYATQQFVMPDGATVRVRVTPHDDHIELVMPEMGQGYQFFTTGPAVQSRDGASLGYSLKVAAVPDKDRPGEYKLLAKAIASTLEADTPEPGKPGRWRFEPVAGAMARAFPRKDVFQLQGVPEHQYFAKDAEGKSRTGVAPYPMLVNSWCQDSPVVGLGQLGSSSTPLIHAIDKEYDVAPSLFQKNRRTPTAGDVTDAPNVDVQGAFVPDADWYKRAAFVEVKHPQHGVRFFCILSDVSNQFHAYPANAELSYALLQAAEAQWPEQAESIKTAISDVFARRAHAPLPAWCRAEPEEARAFYERAMVDGGADWLDEYLVKKPQYRWAFNSTCTKACAVVFEDIAGIPIGNPAHTIPQRGTAGEVQESLPGLVELGIHIAITGARPQDFTFSLSLDMELRATSTKEYVMAADYAWVVREGAAQVTALDDLILLTGAIYHTSDERQTVPSANNVDLDLNALKGVLTVRNHTQAKDIRAFLVSDTNLPYAGVRVNPANFNPQVRWAIPYYEARGLIIACDLRILAFVVQQRLIVQDLSGGIVAGLDDRRQGVYRAAQRVLVYAHNALAQEKVMAPDSPLNAQLADVFANTSSAGLFRFPVDQVGEYRRGDNPAPGEGIPGTANHLHTAYRSLDIMTPRFHEKDRGTYWYAPLNVQFLFYGGSVNAGPFLYYNKIASTLRMGAFEVFSVHPDGSWSVITAPIYYYSGAGTDLANKYPFTNHGSTSMDEQIDPALMRQVMVDIINIRMTTEAGEAKDVRGTHLAAVNQAFGKSWTEQDFLCEFTLDTIERVVPPGRIPSTLRYLTASCQTPEADDVFLVYRTWSHTDSEDFVGAGNPVYLDPRVQDFAHAYATSGPVLRGASLFY